MSHLFEEQYEYASPKLHIKGMVHSINENSRVSTRMSFFKTMTFFLPCNTKGDLKNIYADRFHKMKQI